MQDQSSELRLLDFQAETGLDGWESFSPFVIKVSRALRLAKLPFTHERIAFQRIRKFNPAGQLPVLMLGSEALPGSPEIFERIEQLAPGSLSAGLDAQAHAEARIWEEFGDRVLYPYLLAVRWVDERGWPTPRAAFFGRMPFTLLAPFVRRKTIQRLAASDFTRGGLARCYARLERVLDDLAARAPLSGFWLGPQPTRSDLSLFAQLHALRLPAVAFAAELVRQRPRLDAYLDRVDAATR